MASQRQEGRGQKCRKSRGRSVLQIPRRFRRAKYEELSRDECATASEAQGKVCRICNRVGKLVRDHDHRTGAFRAFLCVRCNFIIGLLETHPELEYFFRYINSEYEDPEDERLEWIRIVENNGDIRCRIEKIAGGAAAFFDYLKRDHQEEKREWWAWVDYCERKPPPNML